MVRWGETHVLPLIETFRCEVLHGKALFGGVLPEQELMMAYSQDPLRLWRCVKRACRAFRKPPLMSRTRPRAASGAQITIRWILWI